LRDGKEGVPGFHDLCALFNVFGPGSGVIWIQQLGPFRKIGENVARVSEDAVTLLLKAWAGGNDSVLDELVPIVYGELRRMAHQQMSRERAGHTLQTDALIDEAFLRLIGDKPIQWNDRAHFFACCAKMMRRILVDHARSRCRIKRGGAMQEVTINSRLPLTSNVDTHIARLDDALTLLEKMDARKAKIVEYRFFGGFSVEETADALKISTRTVLNDWKFAKAWLLRELESGPRVNES
jgi:RNA polymerase sigma-70 factor (ECF subfamily)